MNNTNKLLEAMPNGWGIERTDRGFLLYAANGARWQESPSVDLLVGKGLDRFYDIWLSERTLLEEKKTLENRLAEIQEQLKPKPVITPEPIKLQKK